MGAPSLTVRTGGQHAEVVTFLFTDVEGSTRLLEEDRESADRAIVRHHELLVEAVGGAGGTVFETVGDAVYAAFDSGADGLRAAIAAQRAMIDEDWAACGIARPVRIRVALHRGAVERRGHRYFGMPLFATARLRRSSRHPSVRPWAPPAIRPIICGRGPPCWSWTTLSR
jgi:class 3 adenylate cyclase